MCGNEILKEIKKEWEEYKQTLIEKYPVEEGREWKFTCDHHKKIDEILKKVGSEECIE